MRILVGLLVTVLPSVATAEVVGGTQVTVAPSTASLGGWLAGDFGPVYIGGEIAAQSVDLIEGDLGISYHALLGHRRALSKRIDLLFDGGVGVTQENDVYLGGSDTIAVVPSGALRAQLAFELGHIAGAAIAIGVGTEARGAVDENTSAGGIAVGLAMVVSGGSARR